MPPHVDYTGRRLKSITDFQNCGAVSWRAMLMARVVQSPQLSSAPKERTSAHTPQVTRCCEGPDRSCPPNESPEVKITMGRERFGCRYQCGEFPPAICRRKEDTH